MITAVDMRSGTKFMKDGDIYEVIEASHHKPGKGNTVMRVKERNLRTGATTDLTYRPDEKFDRAYIESKDVQYLYREGDTAYFMDTETFEQYEIPFNNIEDKMLYVVENDQVELEFHEGRAIGMNLPKTVVLTVTETQPQIKGATVTGSGKPATMETGLVVNVPDFINVGERLEVGTDEGDYKGRAKE